MVLDLKREVLTISKELFIPVKLVNLNLVFWRSKKKKMASLFLMEYDS